MQLRALYLHRSGDAAGDRAARRLDWKVPAAAEATDQFRSDPSNPVPSLGGALIRKGGAEDQTSVETRSDVISYTTAPLPDVVEIAGPVRVVLFASSSEPDTDFTAKLVDVTARDHTRNICEGIVRARWREAAPEAKDPEWLEPGEPARFEIDLWAAGHVFQRGHRIRLEIASSNFPRFDRNPGTRDDPVLARPESFQPSEQIVHHDADHPSHVLLPVLTGDRASEARSEPQASEVNASEARSEPQASEVNASEAQASEVKIET
jgi:hypothetical protein